MPLFNSKFHDAAYRIRQEDIDSVTSASGNEPLKVDLDFGPFCSRFKVDQDDGDGRQKAPPVPDLQAL